MGLFDKLFGGKKSKTQLPGHGTPQKLSPSMMNGPLPPGDAGAFVQAARAAWRDGNFNQARLMYQKSSYAASIMEPRDKEQANAMIKSEQVVYVLEDPLFNSIVPEALEIIRATPGIIQSDLYKQMQFDREQVQWALYFAEVIGRIRREKKGRSYALTAVD